MGNSTDGNTDGVFVSQMGYAENFLYMLDAGLDPNHRPNPRLAKALDVMFLLHAEHEMNCSTAAARHLASSGVDVYSAVAGAVGALYGSIKSGALSYPRLGKTIVFDGAKLHGAVPAGEGGGAPSGA